jgi:hypothetical protein
LGLHLGDSNQISFGPPSCSWRPCWSPCHPCDSPRMVVYTEVMSSSSSPSWQKAILSVDFAWSRSCTTWRQTRLPKNVNGQCCEKEYDHMSRFAACLLLQ